MWHIAACDKLPHTPRTPDTPFCDNLSHFHLAFDTIEYFLIVFHSPIHFYAQTGFTFSLGAVFD